MAYPKATLAQAFNKFVQLYVQYGGRAERFHGIDQRNLWFTMASIAAENPEEWLTYDLGKVDGGIEKMPELLNWGEARKHGLLGGKMVVGSQAQDLYAQTHRSPTLAECLLYASTRSKESLTPLTLTEPRLIVGITEEEVFTPSGVPAAFLLSASSGPKTATLMRRDYDWMSLHGFLATRR